MRIQSLNHSCYQHTYHIVWWTKYRYAWLKPYVIKELTLAFQGICKKYPTLFILTWNADKNHVHLQIEIPPNISVSDAVKQIKSRSSMHLQKKFKFIREMYLEDDGIWSVGYFSSTVWLNEEAIKHYIEFQGKKDLPSAQASFGFS
jgi:putative transposase